MNHHSYQATGRLLPSFGVGVRADWRGDMRMRRRPWSLGKERNNCRVMACSGDLLGARPASSAADNSRGIGIAEFLEGKNFLITGGTGFLGKGDTCLCFSVFFLVDT